MTSPTGGTPVTMDPDSVREGADDLGPAIDDLNTMLERVTATLASFNQCWGSDDAGTQFAEEYIPAWEAAVDSLNGLALSLQATQQSLTETADSWQQADEESAANITVQGG